MVELGTRGVILRHLTKQPGASTRTVAEVAEVDESTADYHLRRMQRQGRVSRLVRGRECAWFVTTCGLCPVLRRAVPEVRRPEIAASVRAIDHDPWTAPLLAARAGVTTTEARRATDVLESMGLVDRTVQRRAVLAPGAEVCISRALANEACPEWGRCPISQRLNSRRKSAPD